MRPLFPRLRATVDHFAGDAHQKRALDIDSKIAALDKQVGEFAKSEQRFNQMVANVPGMVYQIVCDENNNARFTFVSGQVEALLGWTVEEALQRSDAFYSLVNADDLLCLIEKTAESRRSATPINWEGRITTPQGENKWMRCVCRPRAMGDDQLCWDCIAFDVTQERKIVEELERSREESRKLALVAENTSNAVIITDADGKIEWVNRGFTRITEYTLSEVVGRKPGSILQGPQTDPTTVAKVREALHSHTPVQAEILNYSKSNRPYWLHVEISPIRDEAGVVRHFMAIETDITHAKDAAKELAHARDAADRANRAKSDFLANMSHEIRTPLAAVLGFSEMLCDDEHAKIEDRQQWADMVRSGGKHLLTLINDLLDVSKIEAGKMEFETLSVSPHELLSEVASIMRVAAAQKSLSLSLTYAGPLPKRINTDPTRLKQVMINLVNNAIKFTDSGSIRIIGMLEQVDGQSTLCVHVADSGIGMTGDQVSRIFAPFVQADSTTTRRFGGTGLGLTISKHICRGLGGDLTVSSQFGVGSIFTMRVKTNTTGEVELVDAAEATVNATEGEQETSTVGPDSLAGVRLLVADDGITNRKLIGLLLRRAGADVAMAENGRQAVELLNAGKPFDLLLLDMQMPEMDGYTTARTLRDAGHTLPIIALTAHAMAGDRQRCIDAGCTDYLTKPINREALIRAIATLLSKDLKRVQKPADVEAVEYASPAESPLPSRLPIEDEEFAEIVAAFLESAEQHLVEMRSALTARSYATLGTLAHWMKGSGGTAGYPALTEIARQMEAAVRAADADRFTHHLLAAEQLLHRARLAMPAKDAVSINGRKAA